MFARPIIRKLREYRMVITRIPARRALIFNLAFRNPVKTPARNPTHTAVATENTGGIPITISLAATAAPRVKLAVYREIRENLKYENL